jgi:hypothetical protein
MTTIATAALREFVATRQDAEASNAEINRELAALRRAFNLAIPVACCRSRTVRC